MAIRRIPVALTIALVLEALRSVAASWFDFQIHPSIGFEVMALDLASSALAVIGLVQLAARATGAVRAGAVVAAISAVAGLVMVFVSSIMRPHLAFLWIDRVIAIVDAFGFAMMIARRSLPLAISLFVIVIAGVWLPVESPVIAVLLGLAVIALELVIAAQISPAAPARTSDPARLIAIASLVLYAVSLFVPAVMMKDISFDDTTKPDRLLGITCLMYGWLLWMGWAANPLLLLGAIFYSVRRPRAAFACGCLAIVSAGIAPVLLYDRSLGMQTLQIGYWLWVASIVTFIIAAYARIRRKAAGFPGALAERPLRLDLGDRGV